MRPLIADPRPVRRNTGRCGGDPPTGRAPARQGRSTACPQGVTKKKVDVFPGLLLRVLLPALLLVLLTSLPASGQMVFPLPDHKRPPVIYKKKDSTEPTPGRNPAGQYQYR